MDQNTIIEEKVQTVSGITVKRYIKGKLLGKGGFAKCYELTNIETKKLSAGKVIPKANLTKARAKQKVMDIFGRFYEINGGLLFV